MASTSGSTVGKGSTTLELIYGSISGMAFGLVSPLASQPFDTLKTKMQAARTMPGRRPHALPSASCEPCHRVPLRSLAALLPPCPSCVPSPTSLSHPCPTAAGTQVHGAERVLP